VQFLRYASVQTNKERERHTHRHTDHNTSHPYWGQSKKYQPKTDKFHTLKVAFSGKTQVRYDILPQLRFNPGEPALVGPFRFSFSNSSGKKIF